MHDLRSLTASERMLLIHAAYGKAMLRAHGLEQSLATLMICHITFAPGDVSAREARIAKTKRLTLGPLIDQFVQAFSPDEKLIEELDNLLFFRNELAHRISETILYASREITWEERVIRELTDIQSFFDEVKPLLQPYVDSFQEKIGISEARILELAKTLYPGIVGAIPPRLI